MEPIRKKITDRPPWLNKRINIKDCRKVKNILTDLKLNTVCQEANCPNIAECYGKGEATFLIMGKICTRNCSFCNVETNLPFGVKNPADLSKTRQRFVAGSLPLDPKEPSRIADAVKQLNLNHIVITSVTRDDLSDGGSNHFALTVKAIREKNDKTSIEVLIPDFKGGGESIKTVIEAHPDIIGHNIETVPRLYKDVRPQADYNLSLKVLDIAKQLIKDKRIYTKSGLMLGMSEKKDEVLSVLTDLRRIKCDFISLGQYLRPSKRHYPVKEYITPDMFLYYKEMAKKAGFLHVESEPYVRSSYRAKEYIK